MGIIFTGCQPPSFNGVNDDRVEIQCSEDKCTGTYRGSKKEFVENMSYKISNSISIRVGQELKDFFKAGLYKKVDLNHISMTSHASGPDLIEYKIIIPFVIVKGKCDAYTSFDHVGNWKKLPALDQRKKALETVLLPGQSLDISELKKTKDGYQEYWIQWKNRELQAGCK